MLAILLHIFVSLFVWPTEIRNQHLQTMVQFQEGSAGRHFSKQEESNYLRLRFQHYSKLGEKWHEVIVLGNRSCKHFL